MSAEFDLMSARELRRLIATRKVSPVEVTGRALAKAEASQPKLNAFFVLSHDKAMAAARAAEAAIMRWERLGPLHGLPLSVKDLIAVEGERFCFGSRTMEKNVATTDAPSVARARSAGAIVIGKTTTSEFGCKPVGDSPLTGITRHPWNLDKTPGGSSGGASSSVAAGITPFALGTDGGGSIRVPASFTGLAGIKASFARVPIWPASATPTLAHVGPLARDVRDAALLLQAIAGFDPRDAFSGAPAMPDLLRACDAGIKGMRIAWSPTLGYARPDPEVVKIAGKAARKLEELGAHVDLVERVFERDPADLWTAEFYAGVGTRLSPALDKERHLLDPAVAEILEAALGQDMRDYYEKVFRRYALRDTMRAFFERYDVLVSPALPVASLDAGRNMPAHLADRNLVSWAYYGYPFNLTGQPAASVCAGIAADGMPVGMQIVGRLYAEVDVVRVAAAFEDSQSPGYNVRPFLA